METTKYAGIHIVKSQKRISFVNELVKDLESRKIYWGMPKEIDKKGFCRYMQNPDRTGVDEAFSERGREQ